MTEARDPLRTPHPFANRTRRLWFIAASFGVFAMLAALNGSAALALTCLAAALLAGISARRLPVAMQVVQALNHSLSLQLAGRLDEAERLLDATEPLAGGRYLQRVFPAHRAQIALDRGDLAGVEQHATLALARAPRPWSRSAERMHMAGALAIRALARALSGDAPGALQDATTVEGYDEASAGTLGRAFLARLAVSARASNHEQLRALCRRSANMRVVAELRPCERAMYRSYRRLAFAAGPGAYREADDPDAELTPEAELFRGRDTWTSQEPRLPELSPVQQAELERLTTSRQHASKQRSNKLRRIGIGVGVILGLAIAVPMIVLAPPRVRRPHAQVHPAASVAAPRNSTAAVGGSIALALLFAVLVVTALVLNNQRHARTLLLARKYDALGDDEALEPLLISMRSNKLALFRAQGNLFAAERAFAAGDFDTALARAEDAMLAMTNAQLRALHADQLVPAISALRALALAALGRVDEARIEYAALLQACPTYALRGSVAHRLDLLAAVTTGAWSEARAVAAQRPDGSYVPVREELLGDLVRMQVTAPELARGRVRDELAENPALSHWLDVVAPGLIERATGTA